MNSIDPSQGVPSNRLRSLDALRGFDMFWLLGGQQIVLALTLDAAPGSPAAALREQFTHVDWEGFRFYDFIFPLFQFLIGVSIPPAIRRRLARGDSKASVLRHAFVRLFWMVLIGWFIHGNLQSWSIPEMRLSYSVLQMLGLGYVIAVACALFLSIPGQIGAAVAFLVGYWILQMFVPVPGFQRGVFQPGGNLGDWLFDQTLGRLGKPWESHWGRGFPFLPMWTHAASTLLGVFAAHIVFGVDPNPRPVAAEPASASASASAAAKPNRDDYRKLAGLATLGLGCLLIAWLWSWHLPIVKNRWTSTFALWCGGLSYLLLALFWWLIDVRGWRRGLGLWTAIGANSILAYVMASLLMGGFEEFARVFLGNLLPHLGEYRHGLLMTLAKYGLAWGVLIHLWRQRIFLRL